MPSIWWVIGLLLVGWLLLPSVFASVRVGVGRPRV